MRYPKVFTSVMAGALALSLGLTACSGGGDTKSSDASTEKTEQVEEKDTKTEEKDTKSEEKDTKDTKSEEKDTKDTKSEDTETEEKSSKDSKSTKDDTESEDEENALDTLTADWETGYMGLSEAGEYYYYAENPKGTEGILVVMNDEGEYVSYVGEITNDKDDITIVTIEDSTTGNTFTFQVVEADEDGNLVLDLGDQGKVIFAKSTVAEVVDAVKKIDANGTAVA